MHRAIREVITARRQLEGGGFQVRRPLPSAGMRRVDPILLIDEMGPADYRPGEAVGAPDHPHRGFETVTYMLDGEFEHRDSAGHAGKLGPGDVQWMTAGRGVVHSELPSQRIMQAGGRVHGFQIWVNLPARLKMTAPRYQEVAATQIPEVVSDDGLARVRVIAGESLGVTARIDTHTPIVYQHWILQPGASVSQALPADHNGLAYVFQGAAEVAGTRLLDGQMGVLGDGNALSLSLPASAEGEAQLLLLGGVPLNESVVQHGPFVMNTRAEIEQAIKDYQMGRMGEIN
ncbi:MAG: pirin family protein [Gammaproteobacteria bacterium]|nr:pirin family protein [Gammaproteobacteria bacterium]